MHICIPACECPLGVILLGCFSHLECMHMESWQLRDSSTGNRSVGGLTEYRSTGLFLQPQMLVCSCLASSRADLLREVLLICFSGWGHGHTAVHVAQCWLPHCVGPESWPFLGPSSENMCFSHLCGLGGMTMEPQLRIGAVATGPRSKCTPSVALVSEWCCAATAWIPGSGVWSAPNLE